MHFTSTGTEVDEDRIGAAGIHHDIARVQIVVDESQAMQVADAVLDPAKTCRSIKRSAAAHLFAESNVVSCKTETGDSVILYDTSPVFGDIGVWVLDQKLAHFQLTQDELTESAIWDVTDV